MRRCTEVTDVGVKLLLNFASANVFSKFSLGSIFESLVSNTTISNTLVILRRESRKIKTRSRKAISAFVTILDLHLVDSKCERDTLVVRIFKYVTCSSILETVMPTGLQDN